MLIVKRGDAGISNCLCSRFVHPNFLRSALGHSPRIPRRHGYVQDDQHVQSAELGGLGIPYPLPDVSRRQSVRYGNPKLPCFPTSINSPLLSPDDHGAFRQGVQDLQPTLHHLPVVSRRPDALQEDGSVSNVQQTEECLPDVSAGP